MVAAAGDEGIRMEHPPLSVRTTDQPGVELAESEQATLATTLAMLAHGPSSGYTLAQLQEDASAECTETPDGRQLLAKRNGTAAGLMIYRDSKQQRYADAEYSGTPPDSPLSATAAAAAAAGLHKLSSASAAEFDAAMGPFAASEDGMQHVSQLSNGNGLHQSAGAGGGNPKSTPTQIMQQLVDCGILPSCGPETHCYVKCGMVQGVFSLASGTILCLCDACSESGQGEPTWFAPAAFERHGGMAASKKWRGSIQVKGLPQRKTLGQWLDERGVTAKPRLTLADQVQQVGGSKQRTGSQALPGRVPAGGSELAAAAANAARLAGLGRAAVGVGGPRAPVSQGNGLVIPTTAMDVDGLEVYSPAGMPQLEPVVATSAGLPQFETYSQPVTYVPVPAVVAPPPPLDPASEQPGLPSAGWVAKLQHLLGEATAAAGAPAAAVQAQEPMPQQQQPQSTLLQQLQQLHREQQQQAAAAVAPVVAAPAVTPAAAHAPAAHSEDPLVRLARLLHGILPAGTVVPPAASEPPTSALGPVPAPAVSARAASPPTATARVVSPTMNTEYVPQASTAAPVSVPHRASPPAAAAPMSTEGQHPTNLLLTLATAKAVSEPMESFNLLSQALQQLLQQHGDACKEAAAAASAAVAAAGEKVCGKNGNGSTVSAAAAFAAIAAAAAAAAAALADECQQQAAVQPAAVQQPVQPQLQHQEAAVISPRYQQQQLQHHQEPVALHHAPDHTATAAAVAAVQDVLAARGVPASVAQMMAGVLGGQHTVQQHYPQQAQQAPSDAYNALVNVFMREFGGAVVAGH